MFHGGTNFGFMNGANAENDFPGKYLPDITSYGKSILINDCNYIILNKIAETQITEPLYRKLVTTRKNTIQRNALYLPRYQFKLVYQILHLRRLKARTLLLQSKSTYL